MMKRLLLFTMLLIVSSTIRAQKIVPDVYQTSKGELLITCIGHGSLMFEFNGNVIHIDPWSRLADYSKLPKADLVLITHAHQDHLDSLALNLIQKVGTRLILNNDSYDKIKRGQVLKNGESVLFDAVSIEAVPAYNTTPSRERLHVKGVGNGYILTFGDLRVYVAGDTEVIPEMDSFKNLSIAFLPMNQPYTMLPEQVVHVAALLKLKVLYPYHYGETSMEDFLKRMEAYPATKVVVKSMK